MPFSQAILLGMMGAEIKLYESQPFAQAAAKAIGKKIPNACLKAWPWLLRTDIEFNCCERELVNGPMAYGRIAHIYDSHMTTLDNFVTRVQAAEALTPWRDEAEKISWLQEIVKVELKKEREIRAVAQGDGGEEDGA